MLFPPEIARHVMSSPFGLQEVCWPWIRHSRDQRDMMLSVRDSKQTFVKSANMMGKDFEAAVIACTFFVVPEVFFSRRHNEEAWANLFPGEKRPRRRIVTTSNTDDHLVVLWSEIGRLLTTSAYPLLASRGGSLVLLNQNVTFADERADAGGNVPSYLTGMVSNKPDKFSGHHAPYSLVMGDEASSIDDEVQVKCGMWARRELWWGNPWNCSNFWRKGIEAGDLLIEDVGRKRETAEVA